MHINKGMISDKEMQDFWCRYDQILEKYPNIASDEWLQEYHRVMEGHKLYEYVQNQTEKQLYESAISVIKNIK